MKFRDKWLDLFLVIPVSVTLIVINILRIIRIPITIDETGFIPGEPYHDLFFKKYPSANNHILHSVIRKFFVDAFGDSLFFLRLDSLLAQVAFLFFSYFLCRLLFNHWSWVLRAFLILNLSSPFLFDFWGLSRGYALGLTFMTISIYCQLRYMQSARLLFLSLSLLGAGLAVYSNFGLLNYYVALIAVIVLQHIIFRGRVKGSFWKELVAMLVFSALLASLITGPLIMLHSGGELGFLGGTGFKADTVTSVVECSLFKMQDTSKSRAVIRVVYYGTLVISAFWLYILAKPGASQRHFYEARIGITLHLLLIIPVLSLVAQFHIFHINYLIDRAAVFFIVLYLLQLVYWLYYMSLFVSKAMIVVAGFVTLVLCYNFYKNVNITRSFLWWFDETDILVLNRMNKSPGKIKVFADWQFIGGFRYDIDHFYKGKFEIADTPRSLRENASTYDYIYIRGEDRPKLLPIYQLDTVTCYGAFYLYKKIQ